MMLIEPPFCDCDFISICEFWSCKRPDSISKSTLILTSFASCQMTIRLKCIFVNDLIRLKCIKSFQIV
ncbi:hypothetical protein DQM28_06310 [Leptospira mayottensis]|uniref:Uncharacterized protein n=1 Tax=Leptospira mayottensis TaxID=1137606 RepID=A0ABN5NQR1_9LEPT|nr:hypothetical protein DQM28_06310 [Leptospira mayottensis]